MFLFCSQNPQNTIFPTQHDAARWKNHQALSLLAEKRLKKFQWKLDFFQGKFPKIIQFPICFCFAHKTSRIPFSYTTRCGELEKLSSFVPASWKAVEKISMETRFFSGKILRNSSVSHIFLFCSQNLQNTIFPTQNDAASWKINQASSLLAEKQLKKFQWELDFFQGKFLKIIQFPICFCFAYKTARVPFFLHNTMRRVEKITRLRPC